MVKEHFREVDEKEFPQAISNGLVVADFFAEWCMPCMMMKEVFENLADKYGEISFIKVNIEKSQNVSQRLEITSIPSTIFFINGQEVDRISEAVDEEFLEHKIKTYLK